jgi:hypothetical protein
MDETLAMLALNISGGGVLAGDVTGPDHANTVVKIQNQAIGAGTAAGQVEQFNGVAWVPVAAGTLPGNTTEHAITQGQTYVQLPTDTFILFDTSAGPQTTATLDMIPGTFIGQEITLKWFAYGNLETPPTIVAPTDTNLVEPFSGMAASGVAGLKPNTVINTPGASWTLKWSGAYWLSA